MKQLVAGTTQLALNWSASTDNVGVTGYRLFRDGVLLRTVTARTTSIPDSPRVTHAYFVRAVDAAGNQSLASNTLSARALAQTTSSTGNLGGVVYNAAGKQLANAIVSLTLPNGSLRSTKTSRAGVWTIQSLAPGTYAATISLAGYGPRQSTLTVTSGYTVLELTTL